jgi:thiazole synthase
VRYFSCDGLSLATIWHCFGNYMHRVGLEQVLKMLSASGTNVIPVNTHLLDAGRRRDDLLIGFGNVTFDGLAAVKDVSQYVLMVNVNHQTTAAAAVEKTLLAADMTGIRTIKLEVLSGDLKNSNDEALVEAVQVLQTRRPDLRIMPLHSNDPAVARELVEAGCPLLRVMGGSIGSGAGIIDEAAFAACCRLGVPVVLDGGVGDADDYRLATRLGASGCLVNSMLFEREQEPYEVLGDFVDSALRQSATT